MLVNINLQHQSTRAAVRNTVLSTQRVCRVELELWTTQCNNLLQLHLLCL